LDSLVAKLTAFVTCEVIVALAQKPVHHPEYERGTCQRSNCARAGGFGIENDELATQRDERDEHNGLDLNDVRSPKGNPNNRVLELHGDAQRHDRAKGAFERLHNLADLWLR
jgi:hypothetical protein